MSEMHPAIFLVDDEPLVRRAVARVLRQAALAVESFDSPEEFLAAVDPRRPGCLVLDMAMPGLSGLDLQRELATRGFRMPVIFLTGRADVPMTVRALKDGAVDFLTKPFDNAVLLASIRAALEKDRSARERDAAADEFRARVESLTPREREVMERIAKGWLNKQVAADLGTKEKTIKVHRARVMEKMKVRSVAELVCILERLGSGGR